MIDAILDRWFDGQTAYEIGADVGWMEKTVNKVVERARQRRDPRAVLHRFQNGRFYGCQRAAARAIVLWPMLRIITIKGRDVHRNRGNRTPVRSRQFYEAERRVR